MNYIEVWEKENECRTRWKDVHALASHLQGVMYWRDYIHVEGVEYAGGWSE